MLTREQSSKNFRFLDATLLLVVSGELEFEGDVDSFSLADSIAALAVPKSATANLVKTPGGALNQFRSIFLTFAPELISDFYQHYQVPSKGELDEGCSEITIDPDFSQTLDYCIRAIETDQVGDRQLHNRLLGVLLAMEARGVVFARPSVTAIGDRLKELISSAPDKRWTAVEASRALALSEASFRRRLAEEGLNFSGMLREIRMHHAMLLLQTTTFSVTQISDACGYNAVSRFSARFKDRFGCSPGSVR
ncbi:helix-turn-helix domain-containing protein [Pseudomonas sp. RIT-To-2]|uniref:helix-turn-helix domain-containing protein n=1 Tax=Pseudomonas sp. RIT-To-2 TaxID=3462541 RepID=UPI0024136429